MPYTKKYIGFTCQTCNREEVLEYKTWWYRVNKGTGKCNSCSKIGGNNTSFKKGNVPHNKCLKGYGAWPKWYPVGEKNPAWKGGVTNTNTKIRNSKKYLLWRKKVLERDDYTCQICYDRGGKLHVDHIKPFAYYPDLRFSMDNARVLCIECHKKTDTYLTGARKYAILT